MSVEIPEPSFFEYLRCDLPEGYPTNPRLKWPLAGALRDAEKLELLRVEVSLLSQAEHFAPTHPWLAYLAVVKHEIFFDALPPSSLVYPRINRQKLFNDSLQGWKKLRREVRPKIDDPTAHFCERLANLQRNATRIKDAEKIFRATIKAGFSALEPMPPKPGEKETGLLGVLSLGKKADGERTAALKAWDRQDSYQQLCEKALNVIKTISPETRANGLKDLPATLTIFADLHEERAALEATYITPYMV